MNQQIQTPTPPAVAGPNAAARRFLVTLLEHAFVDGWRTPNDFIRHFPAPVLLDSLRSATDLRVALLGAATGLHEEILRRKKPALAAEDLHLALEEGMTNSAAILEVFSAEDRVRYLDPRAIWDFLSGDEFWLQEATASADLIESCASRMAFTISAALSERLISLRDILDGLTYESLVGFLSPRDLRTVVSQALAQGRDGVGLSDKLFFEILPLDRLCRVVPLEILWSEVVLQLVAVPCGLTTLEKEERRNSTPPPVAGASAAPPIAAMPAISAPIVRQPIPVRSIGRGITSMPPPIPAHLLSRSVSAPPRAAAAWTDDDQAPTSVPPSVAARNSALPLSSVPLSSVPLSSVPLSSVPLSSVPLSSVPPGSQLPASQFPSSSPSFQALPPALVPLVAQAPLPFIPGAEAMPSQSAEPQEVERRKRERVLERLSAIERRPPNYESLPTPVLSSIDAMYALLPSATDDIQRKSVIRQSFSNENNLRAALLGLIALMDSSIDTSDRVIQEAKIEALIKILLFEEQRRKEAGRSFAARPASSQAPLGSGSAWPPVVAAPALITQGLQAPPSFVPPSFVPSSFAPPPFPGEAVSPQPMIPRPGSATVSGMPAPSFGVVAEPAVAPSHAPLPNLPAEPSRSGGRTVPPPLPPGYQGNRR